MLADSSFKKNNFVGGEWGNYGTLLNIPCEKYEMKMGQLWGTFFAPFENGTIYGPK
tara:strand:- start:1193 stop:1360 length:168 start_codon:yes stop_codon:yes gene_type:complete